MRKAKIQRDTNETQISVEVNIDGKGIYEIDTGVNFLDHMLEQLSKHSLIDIKVKAKGDTHIDAHHSTEDIGIAMGKAFREALGDKKGIRRFASMMLPMDEVLTQIAVDLSGRPYVVWDVNFTQDKLGDIDTELFREWFMAFGQNLGANIHVRNLYGINNHHKAESCFKGLAICLREAVSIDSRNASSIPSTKGTV